MFNQNRFNIHADLIHNSITSFNRLKQIKNAKRSMSQNGPLFAAIFRSVIIFIDASCPVPQYRCCCRSSRWWHILIFATSCYHCHTIPSPFSISSIFAISKSPVSNHCSSNSNSGPKSAKQLTPVRTGASQLHLLSSLLTWIALRVTDVTFRTCVFQSLILSHLCYKHWHSHLTGTTKSCEPP